MKSVVMDWLELIEVPDDNLGLKKKRLLVQNLK